MSNFAKIVTLVDNVVYKQNLKAEHGLSFLVKTATTQLLFDTGQTDLFMHNANVLGEDLQQVAHVVVSHGHYDHTGGLFAFLKMNTHATLWMHPLAVENKQSTATGEARAIGIPFGLDEFSHRIKLVDKAVEIEPNVWLLPQIALRTTYETANPKLLVQQHGQLIPDPFNDELVMYLRHPEGLVLVSGCAHRGIVNTLLAVSAHANCNHFKLVTGGTHLNGAPSHRLEATAEALTNMAIDSFMPNHCTGIAAYSYLAAKLPFHTAYSQTGSVVCVAN
jgi:7,8-dihydropterin-6-yl-methyl-4-(beta-D-ribofuranosyl)aminobenzene 5'-phosphate synthase